MKNIFACEDARENKRLHVCWCYYFPPNNVFTCYGDASRVNIFSLS